MWSLRTIKDHESLQTMKGMEEMLPEISPEFANSFIISACLAVDTILKQTSDWQGGIPDRITTRRKFWSTQTILSDKKISED